MTESTDIEGFIAAAVNLTTELRTRAGESEQCRRLADESIAAMTKAGLFRILTPTAHGGSEAGLSAQVETLLVVSAADSAAGWVQLVSNAHAWMVGNFDPTCQEAVFAGPSEVIPGTLASQGRAEPTDGGWLLNGRWQFASGADHGDWLMLGAGAKRSEANPGGALHVVVPKDAMVIEDTWHVLGLRGTGSNDLVADDVFVPSEFAMSTATLFNGESPHGEPHSTYLYRLPVLVCLSTQLAASVVGMGVAAYEAYLDRTSARREVYTGAAKAEKVGTQMRVAESKVELDQAHDLVRRLAARCDVVASTGERLTIDERVEMKFHASYAVELTRRSVDRLFAGSGAHGVYNDSELQTRYRDVNSACHHAIVDLDGNLETYGRTLLGLDPATPLI
jgi:alkylation response protein AidB-like acyl-CoA dehydrogenase